MKAAVSCGMNAFAKVVRVRVLSLFMLVDLLVVIVSNSKSGSFLSWIVPLSI